MTDLSYRFLNPNPDGILVDDCVYRSLSIVLDLDWETVYAKLSVLGLMYHDAPISNRVWPKLLEEYGFRRYLIPDTCPDCYTVRRFTNDFPSGTFLLSTGTHVIPVKDGNYLDTFDSGDYVPYSYWKRDFMQPARVSDLS